MKFESLNTISIVGLDEETNTEAMHPEGLGEGEGLPDQTSYSLPECQVESLRRICPTTAFCTRNVLLLGNHLTVRPIKIREHQ